MIEKKAGRKAEMMAIKNHGLCGYQWIFKTKFSQVEKSAHPMKVMLETSDFPFLSLFVGLVGLVWFGFVW